MKDETSLLRSKLYFDVTTHVVYPLSSFILDKALVLTRIPVIAPGVNRVPTVDATEHPPVTCQQKCDLVFKEKSFEKN